MVANNRNPGNGTKGTRDPKKLTNANIRYPSSGANGKISPKSMNQTIFRQYLMKTDNLKNSELKYHHKFNQMKRTHMKNEF